MNEYKVQLGILGWGVGITSPPRSNALCVVLARPTGSRSGLILVRNLRHKDSSETP